MRRHTLVRVQREETWRGRGSFSVVFSVLWVQDERRDSDARHSRSRPKPETLYFLNLNKIVTIQWRHRIAKDVPPGGLKIRTVTQKTLGGVRRRGSTFVSTRRISFRHVHHPKLTSGLQRRGLAEGGVKRGPTGL